MWSEVYKRLQRTMRLLANIYLSFNWKIGCRSERISLWNSCSVKSESFCPGKWNQYNWQWRYCFRWNNIERNMNVFFAIEYFLHLWFDDIVIQLLFIVLDPTKHRLRFKFIFQKILRSSTINIIWMSYEHYTVNAFMWQFVSSYTSFYLFISIWTIWYECC